MHWKLRVGLAALLLCATAACGQNYVGNIRFVVHNNGTTTASNVVVDLSSYGGPVLHFGSVAPGATTAPQGGSGNHLCWDVSYTMGGKKRGCMPTDSCMMPPVGFSLGTHTFEVGPKECGPTN